MLILAVYPARAITEIMLEAAKIGEVKGLQDPDPKKNRDAFEQQYLVGLPHYYLIEKIRIHDFHRFGLAPAVEGICLRGPIKLTASIGEATIMVPITGPGGKETTKTGRSKIEEQRPLLQRGDAFWDEKSNTYLRLDQILMPYLVAVQAMITQFQSLVSGAGGGSTPAEAATQPPGSS
jgi:hypothetical protein